MGVALLLASVAELAEALDTPDPATRETAMRELIALGEEAYPDVEAALAGETDSEARARLRYVLEELRPLRLDLLVTRTADTIAWSTRLTNATSRTIEVARPAALHDMSHLPALWIEVESKPGETRGLYDLRAQARVRGSHIRESDIVSIPSGGSIVIPHSRMGLNASGRVRLRAVYVADSDEWTDWTNHPSEAYREEVESVVERVRHGRVVSDWVDLKPPVSPQHRNTALPHHLRPATSPD